MHGGPENHATPKPARQRLGLRQSSGAFTSASTPARTVEQRRMAAALHDAIACSQPKGQAPVLPHPDPLPLGEGESGSVAGQAGRVVLQQARRMVLPPPAGEGWGGGERVEFPLASCAPSSALETKRQRLGLRQSSGAFAVSSAPARTAESGQARRAAMFIALSLQNAPKLRRSVMLHPAPPGLAPFFGVRAIPISLLRELASRDRCGAGMYFAASKALPKQRAQSISASAGSSTPVRAVEKRRKTAAFRDARSPLAAAPAFVAQTFLSAVSPTFQSARRRSRPAVRGLENPRYSRLESLRYALVTAQTSTPLKRRDAENAEKAQRNETPSPSASLCVLRASALNSLPVLQLSAFSSVSDFGLRTSDFPHPYDP
jgi:hypothetical protein